MYNLIPNKNSILIPSNREVKLSKRDILISRTDINGNILYYNSTFIKISGYNKSELLYLPHSILRHHDMPRAIFFIIWKTLLSGRSTHAIIKNFTKNGDYYWVLLKIDVQKSSKNQIVSFLAHGGAVKRKSIELIEPLYKELLEYEKIYGMEYSVKRLYSFLNQNNFATYNDYVCDLIKEKRYGFFSNLRF